MNGGEILLAQSGGSGGMLGFALPFAALLLLMYALVIRPQQRQQRDHKSMLSQLQRGDQIVTTGGLHGKVTGIADDVLTVEIAERVRVRISKSAISSRTSGGGEGKA